MKKAGNGKQFSAADYLAIGVACILAAALWLVHALSLDYTDVVQSPVVVRCNIEGYLDRTGAVTQVAARCDMRGYDIIAYKTTGRLRPRQVEVNSEDMHRYSGDTFYMTSQDLKKYFHDIFGDNAKLEYFVNDTVLFEFEKVNGRKVPVHPVVNITCLPQFIAVSQFRTVPDSVFVYGSEDDIYPVDKVNTETVNLTDLNAKTFGEARLEPVRGVKLGVDKVSYSIDVKRYVEFSAEVPVRATGVPSGVDFQVFPTVAKVRVRSVFPSEVKLSKVYVSVDYDEYTAGTSGRCLGTVMNLPVKNVLGVFVEPEVFDCMVITR